MKQVVVHRHHWNVRKLEHFYGDNKRNFPSTPMACSDMTKIAHAAHREFFIKRKGKAMLFNAPNYPINLTRNDASSLRSDCDSTQLRENLEMHQQQLVIQNREKRTKISQKHNL